MLQVFEDADDDEAASAHSSSSSSSVNYSSAIDRMISNTSTLMLRPEDRMWSQRFHVAPRASTDDVCCTHDRTHSLQSIDWCSLIVVRWVVQQYCPILSYNNGMRFIIDNNFWDLHAPAIHGADGQVVCFCSLLLRCALVQTDGLAMLVVVQVEDLDQSTELSVDTTDQLQRCGSDEHPRGRAARRQALRNLSQHVCIA
jgi:hypothetical protein